MKTKLFSLLVALTITTTLWADFKIKYTGSFDFYPPRRDAFNVSFYDNREGALVCSGTVTTIRDSAFAFCSGLKYITIPTSVTSIGNYAFYGCSNLKSITIPTSVTSIGNYAFYGCSSLTSLYIGSYFNGSSVTTIGDSAFAGCSGLTSLEIPNSVTEIGSSAFDGCSGLTTIRCYAITPPICGNGCFDNISRDIPIYVPIYSVDAYRQADEWKNFTNIQADVRAAITYTASSKLPETTNDLNSGLHTNAFPGVITSHEFSNGVGTITFWGDVTRIGSYAFYRCSGLTSLEIPNSVTEIRSSAFEYCSGLTSVTIPDSVTEIGSYAFAYCSGLTSITIPNSVTTIGSSAFSRCSGLTSITIPNSVTTIGSSAFGLVNNVIYSGTATGSPWGAKCVNGYVDGYFVYSDATKTKLCGCFTAATGEIVIPNSVTEIGEYAFEDCSGLTSIDIPNSVTKIGEKAFEYCWGLTSVTIPNSITMIENNVFAWCSGLTSVTIPNSVTTIGGYAFYKCSGLTSVTIPNSVTTIGGGAFEECSRLKSITIPSSVTTIGNRAFFLCSGLTSITSYATTPPTCGSSCFYQVLKSIPVYVPARSTKYYNAYKYANEWKDFYNFIGNPNDYARVTCTATNGTIEGGGKYIKGDECIMTATANDGYHFTQWNDGNTDNPRSFIVTQDTSFTAQFAINQYILTVQSSDKTKGSVTGGGTYDYQSQLTITATANYGYRFLKWNDGNTSNPRRFTLTKDTTFIAQFTPKNYRVTVQNANPTMGSVLGSGSYSYLSAQTISATANYGYHFVQWNDGNTANPRKFTLTQDTTFIAQFAINQYTFIVQSADNIMGSVTGGGTYDYQSQLTITATANYGYCFLKWNDGITDNPRNFTLTKDSTFIAQFTPQNYQVSVQNANPTMGGVLGSGSYSYLSTQTISATANYGYHFVRWNDGITDNPRTIQVLGDTTFMAEFAKNQYLISVEAEHGKVDGGGNYDYLSSAQISATADEHYHFVKWSDGNTSNPRTISVTENKTYTAVFALDQHIVSATANHGMVSGMGKYDYSQKITLTVIPNVGYQFTQWNDGNTDNPRSFILTQDTSFIAQIDTIWSGVCGDKLTWKYNNGVLIISGTGAMHDYTQGKVPWMTLFKESISSLVINNGCTSIGNYAFYGLSNKDFKTIDLPNGIEQIGQYAFANCEYLKNLYLGLSLEKIAANAFANDERLLYITCYAIEPPLLDESAFVNYDAYLSVPCESQADYKVAKGWKKFNKENVSCIGAEETSVIKDEVIVIPIDNQATFTWPANDQAAGYSIEITKDGEVFCTLKFNAQGQLTGIAFAPSRGGARETASAEMTASGWQFTVTGLNQGSKYGYTLDALNASQQSIKHYEGEFVTDGYTDLEGLTMDNTQCTVRKFIRNNQLQIFRNGKIFNAAGVLMK